jgi:hypothetical protein
MIHALPMEAEMMGLLVTGSHGFATGTTAIVARPNWWRCLIAWLLGRD